MELAPQLNYPDSVDSSPHSINTDSWDEPNSFNLLPSAKIRLMCSYGGHIVPRPHDKSLCYLGGHTRIISFDRTTTNLSCLSSTLSSSLLQTRPFTLKYQLPNEDLDSLISISTDEDLDNMIDEYDRATAASSGVPNRPTRVRLFIFPSKPDSVSAPSSIGSDTKSESWFVDALNGADVSVTRGMSADVNSLLGLDVSGDVDRIVGKNGTAAALDVQSVPDSPVVENTPSLFGSGSSAPSVSRFGADDGLARFPDMPIGVEEQFARMGIGVGVGNKQGEGFLPHSGFSPKQAAAGGISPSEAERVEQGSPAARNLKSPPVTPIHSQQKESTLDFPTETFGRESNPGAAVSRPKPLFYQDPPGGGPIQDRVSASATANPVTDPRREFSNRNYQIPVQFQDPGFMSSPQQEQEQQQQQQQQQHQQQQQQQHQQQQQQQHQQQFFHAMGPQYMQHPATGQLVPISSYYQMHSMQQNPPQQQQQIDQQYSMYYMPVRQNQAYNLAFQSNLGDAHSIHSRKPAGQFSNPATIPTASVYPPRSEPPQRTAAGASQQLIHDQYQQHQHDQYQQHQQHQLQQQQYMGYQQLHNPPPPSQVAASNFMYEFADPSLSQMYYNQPAAAAMAQYQTVNSETLRPPQLAEAKQSGTSQLL